MATAINPQTGERVQWNEAAGEWQPIAAPVATEPETAVQGSLMDPLMEGLTLGWREELGGFGARLGARLAGAPQERIERAGEAEIERQRARLADVRERMPLTSLGVEVLGGLTSGGPLAKGLMAGGTALGLGRIAAPTVAAAIEGGVAGAGAAEESKLGGAALGATLGAGTSLALPAVGAMGQFVGEKTMPLLRKAMEGPETTAGRVLGEYMTGAGETPARLMSRQRQLGPEATFVDIAGAPGQTLGQGIIQSDITRGQALSTARREMAKRAAGASERLQTDLRDITGIEQRLQPSLDAVRARQVAAAGPAYQQAYDATIPLTPKLKNLLARPPMQRAWNEARDAAATRGEELPPFFQLDEFGDWQKTDVMPDMQAWDRMKQGIDRLIESETDTVTGRVTPRGRDLTALKRELVTELDEINPAYAEARKIFAGDEAIQNAMRDGERFLNMKTREVTSAVKDMTDSEKESFLTGAMEAIREKMGRARSGEIGEFRFLEQANTKEKLRAIFPEGREGDRQLAQLMRMLDRERTFATTQGALVGGSQTAMRQAAGEAAKSGVAIPTTLEALTSPGRALAQATLQGTSQSLSSMGREATASLGELLFDPRQTSRAIAEMQRAGINPATMSDIMARYARGGAMVSPLLGLGAGEMMNQ